MKKIFAAAVCLILAAGFATGCKSDSKDNLAKVRLNETVHSVFYAPQYVALEKGFFEEEGLSVTVDVANGSDKSMVALLAGEADISLLGTETGIYAYNEGKAQYPVSFAQLTRRAGNFLVSRSSEPNFKWTDVKGKKIIGTRPGSMPEMLLEYILLKNGLVPNVDVEIIQSLGYQSTSGAFAAGVGDYTAEFEPNAGTLEANGYGYVVASLGADSGTVPYTVYMANKNYIKDNPEVIQKFTNAVYKGLLWTKSHTSTEIAEVILPQFKETTPADLAKMIERYKSVDSWNSDPVFTSESFDLVQDILDQGGQLAKRIPYEDMINVEFAEKSVETIK
jgi:NitT/TauT family transport system substrate-binding protein